MMEVDSDYEFNAPKYIDFLSNEPENEQIDTWFDENPEGHEGGIRISQVPYIAQHFNYQAATKAISAALTATDGFEGVSRDETAQNESDCKSNQNTENQVSRVESDNTQSMVICQEQQDLGNAKENTPDNSSANSLENDANKEESGRNKIIEDQQLKHNKDEATKKKSVKRATRSCTPDQKKRTPISALRKRKHSWNQNASNDKTKKSGNGDVVEEKKPKMEMKKPLITMPNTPSFLRRLRGKNGSVKKTSEALEIERIKALQDETKKKLKSNETFLQKALAPQAVMQTKRATEVTKTMEFNFATDARIKQHPMKTRSDASDNEKFTDQLRKHPPSPKFKNRKPTKPQPFNFSAGVKVGKSEQTGKWKSVATAVNEFQNKTPERWRTRPSNMQNVGPQVGDKCKTKMELTHPKTPQLVTKGRSRPVATVSQAEIEEKIAEEVSSFKFKATEFNHKLVEMSGMYGVVPIKQLPVTEVKPFSFNSDARLEHRKKHEEEKQKEELINKQQEREHVEQKNSSLDSNPAKKRPKVTEPKPFSFESRDKEMFQRKQEKILKIYEDEEKAREFHAQPLPNLSPDLIPVRSGKHTEVAAFNLATDERGNLKQEKWNAQVSQEMAAVKEKSSFKARPCTVIHKEGFKPKPVAKPLVEISEFKLNTEERSKKRESYEIMKRELQRIKEDEMQQVLKERKDEEERQFALLRKQTIHKANPVRNFGDFEVKPSEKPLTMAMTPNFETKKRFGKLSRA